MRLDRLITLGFVSPFRRAGVMLAKSFGKNDNGEAKGSWLLAPHSSPRRLPILMYHSISDDPEPRISPYYKVCTSPKRFAEHMQWLAELGYRGVTLREGLAWLRAAGAPSETCHTSLVARHSASSPVAPSETRHISQVTNHTASPLTKLVAITFDDGFRDFHTDAFPLLQLYGFSATMYLSTAFIGDTPIRFKGRECLTWPEIGRLRAGGIEFGSHTVSHSVLVDLLWPAIQSEVGASKLDIEHHLGVEVTSFAYPFAFPQADVNFATRFGQVLAEAGYKNCVTTEIGSATPATDPFRLRRLPTNNEDDLGLLAAKLAGAYDWLALPQQIFKKLKRVQLENSVPA